MTKYFMQGLILTVSILFFSINYAQSSNNQHCFPFLANQPDQALMLAPAKTTTAKTKTYILPATPATTHWGVFNNQQPSILTINPGDSVVIETMAASDNQVVPGTNASQIKQMNNAMPGRGPHTVTGPIYVNGAEPGDVLKIHFNKIIPRPYASNDDLFGKGLFPDDFPRHVKYFYLDLAKKQTQFAPGIIVPLAPFPGVVAVARAEPGDYSSGPPGNFGGNMDLREMTEGTTLYLPVFVPGGLIWTGDSHAGQGNGEIDLTALETAFAEFSVTIDLIKQQPLAWPRVETATAWIAVGYDKDLNKAFDILREETIKLIAEKRHVSSTEAEKIMLKTWNCPIAEVVNGVQGVYCMVPKLFNAVGPVLPTQDNDRLFVTYAKNKDLEQAMRSASMDMINKVAKEKKMTRLDVYILASLAMDCRIGPPSAAGNEEKAVHCTLAKSLWQRG